jgi:hypothetical protein
MEAPIEQDGHSFTDAKKRSRQHYTHSGSEIFGDGFLKSSTYRQPLVPEFVRGFNVLPVLHSRFYGVFSFPWFFVKLLFFVKSLSLVSHYPKVVDTGATKILLFTF